MYRTPEDLPVGAITLDPFDSPFRPEKDASDDGATAAGPGLPLDIKQTVRQLEIDLCNDALANARYNQRKAAELVGLTYHQFRGYLRKYDLGHTGDE